MTNMKCVVTVTACLLASATFSTPAAARHSHKSPHMGAHGARAHVGRTGYSGRHFASRQRLQAREAFVVAAAPPAWGIDERYAAAGPERDMVRPSRSHRAVAVRAGDETWPNSGGNGFASWSQWGRSEWEQPQRGRAAAFGAVPEVPPGFATVTPGRGFVGGGAGGSVGIASYYGGRGRTASGERIGVMTAAHRSLPFGTMVRVTNLSNGSAVMVRINDRGPFLRNRAIDLSYGAARAIGMTGSGLARVRMDVI